MGQVEDSIIRSALKLKKKYSCCYGCYAYEGQETPGASCLVGEKQFPKKRYTREGKLTGEMLYATRPYCRVKNKKDYLERAGKQLERMTKKES